MTEEYSIGYEDGKSAGFDECMAQQRDSSATPCTWVGLTMEDIDKAKEDNMRFGGFRVVGFAYDLEKLLKEKNNESR
jgi:hypothetical protein